MALPALLVLLASALPVAPARAAVGQPLTVTALRVDRMADPLGIEDPAPSLGWQPRSAGRGVVQTAYQVQVANSIAGLESGALVWDSGRVESAESVSVPYGEGGSPAPAPALSAAQRYFWRVRVWDGDGAPSAWSTPAWWEMALLSEADWQGAEWIAPQSVTQAWTDYRLDVDFSIAAGAAGIVFRSQDASNCYMWQVNVEGGEALLRPHVEVDGNWTTLDEIPLGAAMPSGSEHAEHHLRISVEGARITTVIDGHQVDEREDKTFSSGGVGFRSGSADEDASFENLEVHELGGGELFADRFETSPDPAFPGGEVSAGRLRVRNGEMPLTSLTPTSPRLRTEFTLAQPLADVAAARVYAYGLGFYSLDLSGERVGDRLLAPPATAYERRLRYQTYDVGSLLREGANALGLTLAEGYGPAFSPYGWRWLGPREARLLLEVTYRDGSHQRVVSDPGWRWSEGPVREASVYGGELLDARRRQQQSGWDEPGFDASSWRPVRTVASPGGRLEADTTPPIRVVRTLAPRRWTEPEPGVYVFDLGENVSGWARLRAKGPAGTTVTMRYAEELGPDGRLDTATNGGARATDAFVLAGTGAVETFEPAFTYHGFRYVEVSGLPGRPSADTIAGRVVHADLAPTASFESSDPLLDRIFADNVRSMANNSMSYPTDNPVRDERTGPGMDVQAYADAAVRDFDDDRFLAAYLQEASTGGGPPDMDAANVPLAWALYEQYGDRPLLAAAYPGIVHAVSTYLTETEAEDYVWPEADASHGSGFGDWCPPVPASEAAGGLGGPAVGGYETCFSEVSLVDTALAYRDARIAAAAARALGKDEAGEWDAAAARIEAGFEARFATADGYGSGRQVTSILPLAFGMVPAARREAVAGGLVERILDHDDGHLDTGIFGTRFLLDALVAAGRPDVALTVLDQTSYPGFGYEIESGATTDWEEWTYSSGMESHDHAMFAGINASFTTKLAGIEPTQPGYAAIRIAPAAPAGLERVAATLDTVRGEVASAWRRSADRFELDVTVPPNATAAVHVPVQPGDEVRESGGPAASSPGVSYAGEESGAAVYEVGSGSYRFTAKPAAPKPPGHEPAGRRGVRPPSSGPASPPAPPVAQPRPRARLRAAVRLRRGRRIALAIVCRAHCPRGPRRIHVTVLALGRHRHTLARRRTRLVDGRAKLRFELPAGEAMPLRLRVTVSGLRAGTVRFAARLRARRHAAHHRSSRLRAARRSGAQPGRTSPDS